MAQVINYLDSLSKIELEQALTQPQFSPYLPLYSSWLEEKIEIVDEEEIEESLGSEKEYFLFNPPVKISLEMAEFLNLPRIVTMEIFLNSWLIYFLEKSLLQGEKIEADEVSKRLLSSNRLKWKELTLPLLSLLLAEKVEYTRIKRKERKELFFLAQRSRQKLNSL